MKQLLLVRHAKSDWDNIKLSDFERPLNKRGLINAPEMAERLRKQHIIPEHIVSSPASRAITTANFFAEVLGLDKQAIQTEENIYEASPAALLNIINKLSNEYERIALFGHNPGLTTLAMNLCNSSVYNIPTCGIMLIEFPFDDWKMISYGTGEQKMYDYPKNS